MNISYHAYMRFRDRRRFTSANTQVRIWDGEAHMYLFGNEIAKTDRGETLVSCGGYPASNTTRDRLNAFPGIRIRKCKSDFIVNEKFKWDGKWLSLNNIERSY